MRSSRMTPAGPEALRFDYVSDLAPALLVSVFHPKRTLAKRSSGSDLLLSKTPNLTAPVSDGEFIRVF